MIHRTGPGKVLRLAGGSGSPVRGAPLVVATRGYVLSLHGHTLAVHNATGRLSAGLGGVGAGPRGVAAESLWEGEAPRGRLAVASAGRGPGAQVLVAASDGREVVVLDALLPYTAPVEEGTAWMRVPALFVGLFVAAFWFVRHRRQQRQQQLLQQGAMGEGGGMGGGVQGEGEEDLARQLLRDMRARREEVGLSGPAGPRQRFAPRGTWAEPAFSSGR